MSALRERLETIRGKIDKAAQKSGRSLKDVTLIAVTKGVDAGRIAEAREAGLSDFGENKIQEAEGKLPELPAGDARWHMIGHLQTNKIKKALQLFHMIQSVDSVRLAQKISEDYLAMKAAGEAVAAAEVLPVLLEVNVSGEEQKYGFKPEEVYGALEAMAVFSGIRIQGLMGMAPLSDENAVRASFKKLRSIFSVCKSVKTPNMEMKHLSMGMSGDYEIAVEEGSNMVRIGRALFPEKI